MLEEGLFKDTIPDAVFGLHVLSGRSGELPGPMTDREPTFTPGQRIAPPPIHTSEPISTGLPNSCFRRNSASSGWGKSAWPTPRHEGFSRA
jgi:hypothetical protein